jgi:hypothetical protein
VRIDSSPSRMPGTSASAIRQPIPRRSVLERLPLAGLVGVSALLLPAAADAASPEAGLASPTSPAGFTVDDSGSVLLAGHDVTYRVALFATGGTAYSGSANIQVSVRLDDGTADGAGSIAPGTRIQGQELADLTVSAESGSANISVDLPAGGTYLVSIATVPAALSHPDGIVLAVTVA